MELVVRPASLLFILLLLDGRCMAQDPATDLSVTFAEDTELLQHAVFDFSWTPPPDKALLEGYQLVVEHVAPDDLNSDRHSCGLVQETVSENVAPDAEVFRLRAIDDTFTSLPIYTCMYRAWLVSLPGGNVSNTLNISVSYNSPMQNPRIPRVELDLTCEALYIPETVMYNINLTWDLSNQHPLARGALLEYEFEVHAININIIPGEPQQETSTEIIPKENVTEVTAITVAASFGKEVMADVTPPKPTTNSEEFYWREPILPRKQSCPVLLTPFVQPSQVERDSIRFDVDIRFDQISFEAEWDPPKYLNGDLDHYELCARFGDVELEGQEMCDSEDIHVPNVAMPSSNVPPQEIKGPMLIMQVRTFNTNFMNNIGNWSEAVSRNTTVITTSPTATPGSGSGGVPPWIFGLIGGVLLLTLLALVVVVIFIVNRRYCFHWFSKEGENLAPQWDAPPTRWTAGPKPLEADEWEIKREDVELLNKALGEGAFGAVYKGILQPKVMDKLSRRRKGYERERRFTMSCVVAVKMLKADTMVASHEKVNFLKEIEMMKNVSGGENAMRQFVVNMLGCVTTQEPMLLILEFVSHGDLQSYLRSMRKKLTEGYFNPDESEPGAPYLEPSGAYSNLKPKDEDYEELGLITERNLVDFARQIAAGMEYLSSLGIVHRDLACRNVLVGEGKALKVSDFGMSRLLPPDEVYVPTSHGPLPLRWMAIEALFYRHFTTKTDVWSFGVVLWEICTMGGFPYPTTSNRDLPEMLRSGYRMDKPETCSLEVYEVMLDCWNHEAGERPMFQDLHKLFDDFLTQQTQDSYPYMEVLSKPYHLDDTTKIPAGEPDHTPINLDIEITDVDADETSTPTQRETRLMRSVSQNNPRRNNLGLTPSNSNFSLRSLQIHNSLQDMQTELARQADWLQVDLTDGREKEDTRYVDSPTSFTRNNSRRLTHLTNHL